MAFNNMTVRRQNKINVYKILLTNNSVSRQKIADKLQLSLPTVALNLKELVESGLAIEDGELFSTGGRKASTISCLPNARISTGIDITQHHIGFAAVNLKGDVIAHVRLSQEFSLSEKYDDIVCSLLEDFISQQKISKDTIIGVGISLPGIINSEGTVLTRSHLLEIKEPTKIGFLDKISFRTRLFNDATSASLAEVIKSPELKNMVFLSLSNSIGGSIIIDGKSVDGDNEHSGEFGHICAVPNGRMCYCGQKGHFDSYCSAPVLANLTNGNLDNFFKRLSQHDHICENAFNDYLHQLSIMICNLRMIFDTTIVLGGYVGSYLAPYLDEIKNRVQELDMFHDPTEYIRVCQYKYEAAAVGASLYFIDSFIQNL